MGELGFVLVGGLVAIHGALRAAWSPCGQSMLASLTPVAERARGSSWRVTVTAFALGAVAAGAAGGALLGGIGSLLPGAHWRMPMVIVALTAALVIDGTPLRRRLPLTKRQVNEDWMHRYRGWVYGLGFGAQLGFGLSTIVSSAAMYVALVAAFLAGDPLRGAIVTGVFGLVRGLTILAAAHVRRPDQLVALHRRLARLRGPSGVVGHVLILAVFGLALIGSLV